MLSTQRAPAITSRFPFRTYRPPRETVTGNTPIEAQLNPREQTQFAPAEDRATLGSDPSADWSPANGKSGEPAYRGRPASPCRCRNKSDKSIPLFNLARLQSQLACTAITILPRIGGVIVVNHWQPCHAPTLPLVTPSDSIDLPKKIAIN